MAVESEEEGRNVDDYENPYQSPGSDDPTRAAVPSEWSEDVDPRTIGKARSVPTVAKLMILHGALMFVAGVGLISMMAFIAPQIGQQIENQQEMQRKQNPNAPRLSKEAMTTMLYAMYGAMSVCLFVIGSLNIFAGIRNHGYRNRILGVVSLVLNMGSVFFCWCLPFSIGLMIYGMIIFLSPEAERAFRWRSEVA